MQLQRRRQLFKINLTANSCIAICSSTNAVTFIRTHDETLSVAMRVSNPDRSPLTING
jgi:hypothetical protein